MNTEIFTGQLESEREKLEQEMQTVGQKNPSVPGDFEPVPSEKELEADIMDRATIATDSEDNRAILNELELRYADVLAALARIHTNTYGLCVECNEPIEEVRLAADPAAKTCKTHMK